VYAVNSILGAAAQHGSLKALYLNNADLSLDMALDELVSLAITNRYSSVYLGVCLLPAAPLPALTRLIKSGALEEFLLQLRPELDLLADAQSVPAFFDSLKRLRRVYLNSLQLEDLGPSLLSALSESASLKALGLSDAQFPTAEAQLVFGEGLAQLVAKSVTLDYLDLDDCALSSEALQPFFAVLGTSKTLQTLKCSGNDIDAGFSSFILPAVKLNTSLRTLVFDQPDIPELVEAEALVKARNG
jgi:hypothetical protein